MKSVLPTRSMSILFAALFISCSHSSEPSVTQETPDAPRDVLLVYSEGEQILLDASDGVDPLSSRFAVYSLAKPMTSAAALRLMEKGALRPDSDIRDFLPEFPVRDTPVRLIHLATHQSGIRHYKDDEATRECRDIREALDRFRDDALVVPPGTSMSYSSHGFIALSAVIARANDSRFDVAMNELVFDPLNIAPQLATVPRPTAPGLTCKFGAGGYLGTADEIARFALGLFGSEFLSDRSQQMFLRGSGVYRASGQGPGGAAHFWVRPDDQSAVILLSDASDADAQKALRDRFQSEVSKLTTQN